MFIDSASVVDYSRIEQNALHFAQCGIEDKRQAVSINIPPLCGGFTTLTVLTPQLTLEASRQYQPPYSYLSDSIGSSRAAFHAGHNPKIMPIPTLATKPAAGAHSGT